jgi:hypothetical protein
MPSAGATRILVPLAGRRILLPDLTLRLRFAGMTGC